MLQSSRHTTDAEAREWMIRLWPEINSWTGLFANAWVPAPGSPLAEDDAEIREGSWLFPAQMARMSLAIGTDHLVTAASFLLNHGPRAFAINTLLRTASIGGAQAIWLLAPEEHATRIERYNKLDRDSTWNHQMWAKHIGEPHPDTIEPKRLAEIREVLDDLASGQTRPEVSLTQVIRLAAEYLYSTAGDPYAVSECLAIWRLLSASAHALPWEQVTRPSTRSGMDDEYHGTRTIPSLTEHLGALSLSYSLLKAGFTLIELRGGRPLKAT